MKSVVYSIFLFILFSSVSFSQWIMTPDFDARAKKGIEAVYNLEFDKAEHEFTELSKQYPTHPAGKFFLAMIDWWKILIVIDNESYDDTFLDKMDDVIELCDSLLDVNENNVGALFFKGGALGFQGRLRANRSSWIKAANDGRRALPIVQKAFSLAPDNYDILLGIGIYNYYAATIPEQYPIVKPVMIFFPTGDKQKGIEQLTIASNNAKFAAIEAKYFLLQLNYNYEHQYTKSYELSTALLKQFPNNVIFHRYVGRSSFSLSKYGESESAFREIINRCDQAQIGYTEYSKREALYYLGLITMNLHRYDEALNYLEKCIEMCQHLEKDESSGYLVMANLRVGMIYDVQQKRNSAIMQYQKVQRMKNFEDSQKMALKYLKSPYIQ